MENNIETLLFLEFFNNIERIVARIDSKVIYERPLVVMVFKGLSITARRSGRLSKDIKFTVNWRCRGINKVRFNIDPKRKQSVLEFRSHFRVYVTKRLVENAKHQLLSHYERIARRLVDKKIPAYGVGISRAKYFRTKIEFQRQWVFFKKPVLKLHVNNLVGGETTYIRNL